jgi:hypothetical protein
MHAEVPSHLVGAKRAFLTFPQVFNDLGRKIVVFHIIDVVQKLFREYRTLGTAGFLSQCIQTTLDFL